MRNVLPLFSVQISLGRILFRTNYSLLFSAMAAEKRAENRTKNRKKAKTKSKKAKNVDEDDEINLEDIIQLGGSKV